MSLSSILISPLPDVTSRNWKIVIWVIESPAISISYPRSFMNCFLTSPALARSKSSYIWVLLMRMFQSSWCSLFSVITFVCWIFFKIFYDIIYNFREAALSLGPISRSHFPISGFWMLFEEFNLTIFSCDHLFHWNPSHCNSCLSILSDPIKPWQVENTKASVHRYYCRALKMLKTPTIHTTTWCLSTTGLGYTFVWKYFFSHVSQMPNEWMCSKKGSWSKIGKIFSNKSFVNLMRIQSALVFCKTWLYI